MVLVQEFAPGGDLFKLMHKCGGHLSEDLAVRLVLQPVLAALQYLHTRGIVHRDLKVRRRTGGGGSGGVQGGESGGAYCNCTSRRVMLHALGGIK